ncbi:MAG: hypothetical protein HY861_00790 [Chlamydiia bacterium]|nr:hypothetical protein [Chlamydiia bacterium]
MPHWVGGGVGGMVLLACLVNRFARTKIITHKCHEQLANQEQIPPANNAASHLPPSFVRGNATLHVHPQAKHIDTDDRRQANRNMDAFIQSEKMKNSPIIYHDMAKELPDHNCFSYVFQICFHESWGDYQSSADIFNKNCISQLQNRGYAVVDNPQEGDLVIYYSETWGPQHFGQVASASDATGVMIRSKWGFGAAYPLIHRVDIVPESYGEQVVYMRHV